MASHPIHISDPYKWVESPYMKTWRDSKFDFETRFEWGHYYNLDFFNPNQPVNCWISSGFYTSDISLEELYKITQFLKENIDNPWEGPIGYMGFWKFRFTTEEDRMVFKLLR